MQGIQVLGDVEQLLKVVRESGEFLVLGNASVAKTVIRLLVQPENGLVPAGVISYLPKPKPPKTIKGVRVAPIRKYKKFRGKTLVVAAVRDVNRELARKTLTDAGFENVVYISDSLFFEMSRTENVPMAFMCAGFTKCGTTSLNVALKKNKKIFLSKQKETNYMHWRKNFDDSPERFKRMYYPKWKKDQILGNVEPTYHRKSASIYECFGNEMKLIFMMRNPVDATYSYFKMMMRRTQYRRQLKYYLKHNRFDIDMFDDYIRDYIVSGKDKRFKYDLQLSHFLELWPPENIKYIFFEDIIRNTEQVMNEVQEFIGVEPVKITEFPPANIGSTVSKNFIGAFFNAVMFKARLRIMSIPSKKVKSGYKKLNTWLWKHTQVENHEKMRPESRAELTEFYMDSIKQVEKITGRDLKGVWY